MTEPDDSADTRCCGCLAYHPVHNDHTKEQHTDCGWGYSGPCGGCDRCISAQIDHYAKRRRERTAEHRHTEEETP